MHKVSGPGATSAGEFTDGNPSTGVPPTTVPSDWLNTMQRELVALAQANGVALDAGDDTQVLVAIQALIASAAGGGAGGKNLLVNGDFTLQQRVRNAGSFSLTNAAAYTLDRWVGSADSPGSGAGTATVTRQTHTVGQTDVPGAVHYLRWQQTVAATVGAPRIAQRVEDVRRFGLGLLTASVYLKASGALTGTLRITQKFGTGGSPSADVLLGTQACSLTTSWGRFSINVDLASFGLTGKTLGTAGDSHLLVELHLPQSATYTVEASDFQLERNAAETAFDRRAPGHELFLAQRYYERTGRLDVAIDTTNTDGVQWRNTVLTLALETLGIGSLFRVVKRRIPTMRWWHPDGTPDQVLHGAVARAVNTAVSYRASELYSGNPTLTSGTAGSAASVGTNWEADAEI